MRAPRRMGLPVNVVRGALGQGGGRVIPQDGVGCAGCELACHGRKTPRHQACSHPWDGSGSQWPGPRGLWLNRASATQANPRQFLCLCARRPGPGDSGPSSSWPRLALYPCSTCGRCSPGHLGPLTHVFPDLLPSIQAEPSSHPSPGR